MAISWKELIKGVTLTPSADMYYITPDSTAATIQAATVYNPTGGPVTFTLYKVPTGMLADNTTKICSRVVPAGAVIQAQEAINHKLEKGTQLLASGLALTLNISGVEYIAGT